MENGYVKKRLVFYFNAFDGFMGNRAIQLHLRGLKHYAHIFDEALFIISVEDTENDNLIYAAENEIIKMGFKDLHFKVYKSNPYCEVQPFFEEIVRKMKELDGITFFGHTKGTTNYSRKNLVKESIDSWIVGMYYLNFEFMDEVVQSLIAGNGRFYGAFLMHYNDYPYDKFIYSGTFYWLNCPAIWVDKLQGLIDLPEGYGTRWFAEDFPGILYDWENGLTLTSHDKCLLYFYDSYAQSHTKIPFMITSDEEMEGYEKFKAEMLEGLD